MSEEEQALLKGNPELARRVLDHLRYYVVRELDEKCLRCGAYLFASPEYDVEKYCKRCGLMYPAEGFEEAEECEKSE